MDDWAGLNRALHAIAASGSVEVREDGEWLAELATLHCELHHEEGNPLVHLWSDGRSLTRRVLRIREQVENRIVLDIRKFGRPKPSRLEFLRADSPSAGKRAAREQFRARFRRMLCVRFPDAEFESLTIAPDLKHSLSGLYVRGQMREGEREWALLAVSAAESAAAIEGILAFGILWLDRSRKRAERGGIEGLRLFVPEGTSRLLRERALALSSSARVEIFEFREADYSIHKADIGDTGNFESRLIPRREVESALQTARDAVRNISPLGPKVDDVAGNIRLEVIPGAEEVALSFRGLDFALWSRESVHFGLGDSRKGLAPAAEPALAQLIEQLELHRNSLASETKHPLYRAAPERWLETLVLEDPSKLDAQLDPRHLYSQVPAVAAGDRGVLDLLGVTRRGRLVVIELKASEDIQMPIQALDYWLRVRRHQRQGDFHRLGYFSDVELDPKPPLIWLVAPGLHFHPATDILQKYISPEIEVTRIGLNEGWRRGVKVIFRQ